MSLFAATGVVGSIIASLLQHQIDQIVARLSLARLEKKLHLNVKHSEASARLQDLERIASDNQASIDTLESKIEHEADAMSTVENVCVVTLGMTGIAVHCGARSSTFLNRLCGDISRRGDKGPFKAGDSLGAGVH